MALLVKSPTFMLVAKWLHLAKDALCQKSLDGKEGAVY